MHHTIMRGEDTRQTSRLQHRSDRDEERERDEGAPEEPVWALDGPSASGFGERGRVDT